MSGSTTTNDGSEREHLVLADQAAHRDFDRLLTTLASGGLAISLVFVHDVAPRPIDIAWIIIAWSFFILTLLANLFSYLSSIAELRAEIDRVDRGDPPSTPGPRVTACLNWASAITFCLGVVALITFAAVNI